MPIISSLAFRSKNKRFHYLTNISTYVTLPEAIHNSSQKLAVDLEEKRIFIIVTIISFSFYWSHFWISISLSLCLSASCFFSFSFISSSPIFILDLISLSETSLYHRKACAFVNSPLRFPLMFYPLTFSS